MKMKTCEKRKENHRKRKECNQWKNIRERKKERKKERRE